MYVGFWGEPTLTRRFEQHILFVFRRLPMEETAKRQSTQFEKSINEKFFSELCIQFKLVYSQSLSYTVEYTKQTVTTLKPLT